MDESHPVVKELGSPGTSRTPLTHEDVWRVQAARVVSSRHERREARLKPRSALVQVHS
jgi:hypothetical protein